MTRAVGARSRPWSSQPGRRSSTGACCFEGGRLDPDGTIRLLGSETASRPALLGRPLALADFAVAYRAVFHGGLGEPYMSLDRGGAPQTSLVNYGGRLQDTSLGLVSLLCDIRFKTFSLGIDVVTGRDLRESLRRELPSFRTHQERFASDRRSAGVLTQQTRLWFYPDSVDLTLSPQNDVLVLRRPRMSAASERIQQDPQAAERSPDPPWTAETVAAINRDYDRLNRIFPELADLDQVVRLLSFFTWLKEAGARGMALPDLDVLLALELPAQPTPRRFPQLLAYNVLPPSGEPGEAQVFNRISAGEALDALQPRSGQPLPAPRRFHRALAALDRRQGDHAALAQELEGYNLATLDDSSLDVLAYRAERLRMHQLVLNTLPPAQEQEVERRREQVPGLRTISVGIGGLDLGMSQALARAEGRNEKLQVGAGGAAEQGGGEVGIAGQGAQGSAGVPGSGGAGAGSAAPAATGPGGPWPDPPMLPTIALPPQTPGAGEVGRSWTATGAGGKGPEAVSWIEWVTGAEGPEPRSRRLIAGGRGSGRTFERLEEGRFLRYRLAAEGPGLAVVPAPDGLPPALAAQASGPQARAGAGAPGGSAPVAELPQELATMEVQLQGAGETSRRGRGRRALPRRSCRRPRAGRAPAGPRRGRARARRGLPPARAAAPRARSRGRPRPRQASAGLAPATKVLGGAASPDGDDGPGGSRSAVGRSAGRSGRGRRSRADRRLARGVVDFRNAGRAGPLRWWSARTAPARWSGGARAGSRRARPFSCCRRTGSPAPRARCATPSQPPGRGAQSCRLRPRGQAPRSSCS